MAWAKAESLEEYLSVISKPPVQKVLDLYEGTATVKFENSELDTTIVTVDDWSPLTAKPTVTVEEGVDTKILDDYLVDFAILNAFQRDGVREVERADVDDYMWNGDTYIVSSSPEYEDDRLSFSIKQSDFYSVVSHTSRILGELLEDTYMSPRSIRERYFDTPRTIARNIDTYYRPLGGSNLTVVKAHDGTHYVLLGKRSSKVALWPDLLTAFPAGYFKPNKIDYGTFVDQQMLSEFSREAMAVNNKETADDTLRGVTAITQLLRAGKASFDVTGFGYEGATIAAEITGVLQINDPDYTNYLFENFEQSYDLDHMNAIPLTEDMTTKFESIVQSGRMTPQSAFAFGNALVYLDNHTDIEIPFSIDVTT